MFPGNVDLGSRLRAAVQAHVGGRLAEAETLYREVLRVAPSQFDALHNLGVLKLEQRDHEEALELLRRSLAVNPGAASAHLNIGSALRDLKRPAEALESYNRALAIRPEYPQAYNNRGVALRELGHLTEAVDSYRTAIAGNPDYVEAMGNCATALLELQRYDDALEVAEHALSIRPTYLEAHLNRGHALYSLKRFPEAIAAYQDALRNGGNANEIRYYLAALGVESTPVSAPRSYVEGLFDHYAERFDASLRGLKYQVPEMMFEIVSGASPGAGRDVADLGCGTGMCGQAFRPMARSLVGVDISGKMLDKARERGIYDHLEKNDLATFLHEHPVAFDLLVAGDVFIYVGELEAIFASARRSLRANGLFAFSVESSNDGAVAIRPSRRFAHSVPYIRGLATQYGFAEKAIIDVAVRQEEGQDIPGFIVLLGVDSGGSAPPSDNGNWQTE
ncbi:MAG TPA: tetratricopeptide repeat protein [Alphaproteobacteria bacterium]|jgi:predicted TPR repeat methyltransferase|nr:tetratricopeptide repeat protein [Alphaproteobacteria bacterium]